MSWLTRHISALTDALARIRQSGGNFVFNVLVVATVLSLPFAGLTLLENLQPVAARISVDPEISVFLAPTVSAENQASLTPAIKRLALQASPRANLQFVPKDQALTQMKQRTGLAQAVAVLGENPLPDAYVLRLPAFQSAAEANRAESLAASLRALPGVEHVEIDSAWIKRLSALLNILRFALLMLATTLSIVIVAVVFNTIRLQVMTQREEIDVSRLFGATDAYIRRPFYYAGGLLGLMAGAIALGAIAAGLPSVNGSIQEFARMYASEFQLVALSLPQSAALLAASAALGLLGAGISVRRHLGRTSPD